MKVLFVDDSPDRIKEFRWNWVEHEIHTATTATEALAILETQSGFDLIFLDHDLADTHYEEDCEDETTGTYLAQWIAARPEAFQTSIFFCHSLNHAGRNRMLKLLQGIGIFVHDAPWAWKNVVPK